MELDKPNRIVNGIKVYLTDAEIATLQAEQLAYSNDLTLYKQNIDIKAQALIDRECVKYRYDNIYQVTQFATVEGEFQDEAIDLLNWNARIWELTELHVNTITEIPTTDFIQTLPAYERIY